MGTGSSGSGYPHLRTPELPPREESRDVGKLGVWDPFGPWAPFTMKSAPLKGPGKEQKEGGRPPTSSDIPSSPTLLFQGPTHSAFKKQNLSSQRRGWIMQVMEGSPHCLLSHPTLPSSHCLDPTPPSSSRHKGRPAYFTLPPLHQRGVCSGQRWAVCRAPGIFF